MSITRLFSVFEATLVSASSIQFSLHPNEWTVESITMNKASGGDGIPVELVHFFFFFNTGPGR